MKAYLFIILAAAAFLCGCGEDASRKRSSEQTPGNEHHDPPYYETQRKSDSLNHR
jgi:hypothetical protein